MARPKKYQEPRVTTAIRLPADLHRQLQETAQSRDTSLNHLVVKAAALYLSRLPPLDVEDTEGEKTGTSALPNSA